MADENDDLRTTLEAAFEEDAKSQEDTTPPPSGEEGKAPVQEELKLEGEGEEKVEGKKATETLEDQKKAEPKSRDEKSGQFKKGEAKKEEGELKPKSPFERAPDSWKADAKAGWEKVPDPVRREIYRREQEVVQVLQQTATERKIAGDFQQAVYPFEVFLRAENVHPIQAVRELFGQAAILRVGTPAQKAQLVANVVKQFGVSIQDLDSALVGENLPDEDGRLTRIIQQQLAPVNQFMQQIGNIRQQRSQQVDQGVESDIDAFASDPKNKYFYEVNNDMADLMEMAAKQGVNMTLADAYAKACKFNDRVQQMITQEKQQEMQNKRNAGSSLPSRGAPPTGTPGGTDNLHSDILSAWDSVASR